MPEENARLYGWRLACWLIERGVHCMYQLAPDEKTTTVMVYSHNKLIHGDLITRQSVRVSILPRMQALTNFLHFYKTQVWFFGGGEPKLLTFGEYFFPVERMIGMHIAPPAADPLDYETDLANRGMCDLSMILGMFIVKGKIRVSTQVETAANLELAHKSWLSIYEADVSSPLLHQMPVMHVPMLIVRPSQASFGL
jgi:hypothetical protein